MILPLTEWRDFYVMIGTASGAIVGATFVVITLFSERSERAVFGLRGFMTPTALHLGSALVGSAVLTVPTLTPLSLAVLLGIGGIAGAAYSFVVASRIWTARLDRDDRFFYVILPILAYVAIAAAALLARTVPEVALNILAAALVGLLVIGMRNAWDMATFLITRDRS